MPRWTNEAEAHREAIEAELSTLGNALVYLSLIHERLDVAVQSSANPRLLLPAFDDLNRAADLVRRCQARIRRRYELESQQQENSRSSPVHRASLPRTQASQHSPGGGSACGSHKSTYANSNRHQSADPGSKPGNKPHKTGRITDDR